jgi:hypothetical protein
LNNGLHSQIRIATSLRALYFAQNFQAMRFTFCCVRTLEAGIPCAAKRNKPANVVSLRMRAIGNIALCSEVATQVKRPFDRTDCEYLWADHVSVW